MPFTLDSLRIDCEAECRRLVSFIRQAVGETLRKRGVVVGVSGGIDSSVTAALCVRALGPERVAGLLMPERDSDPRTLERSRMVADALGIRTFHRDITSILAALGFYEDHAATLRRLIPEYGEGWKSKMTISDPVSNPEFAFFWVVARSPAGVTVRRRLPADAYRDLVALSNFKQRTRKMLEYHYADRLNYAVGGTSNRLESDQGFFVKLGDGAGDIKPIAHLYKSQVFQMAEHLGVPEAIRRQPPSADIHSLAQGQDEFFFVLPYEKMDACVYGERNGLPAGEVASAIGADAGAVGRLYRNIAVRRTRTEHLRALPLCPDDAPDGPAKRGDRA